MFFSVLVHAAEGLLAQWSCSYWLSYRTCSGLQGRPELLLPADKGSDGFNALGAKRKVGTRAQSRNLSDAVKGRGNRGAFTLGRSYTSTLTSLHHRDRGDTACPMFSRAFTIPEYVKSGTVWTHLQQRQVQSNANDEGNIIIHSHHPYPSPTRLDGVL